ncbi:tRNA nucleotidyltransferase [Cordyceps fumosorosea ARSEF 2679]|uniref:tRNA nucleotidyltransferase n=1 Tax=Cordyceps fumosorosea (strain ARSEF 2679) TaxID=1081104 RepID=A0A162IEI7_CORFA|nr:tRNA nucleotidyltransferase [Cordyceps fumosorosea ARSEF 2679]OAA56015.1 tRNA nucleotidyltransferase [Cordyceps fumosorosea ARSEF 2679]
MPISTKIQLDPRERRLRDLLVDVAGSVDGPRPVVLRWAGGWVRDKLLGSASHDIDVAIDTMTGGQFTAHLREHCQRPEVVAVHNLAPGDVGSPHTVARQPDKSKHLETAILRLFGLDLDFVNLRKETYADDSRNPQMEFGTAEEDAMRRDATINALFYNLNTEEVEDFTGGLADMERRIIRTPLEPLQTFKDDPLRVLRLVRFSSRLDFAIDENTRKVMADETVLEALKVKISRERVGQELEKMLQDKHPRLALQLIDDIGLYHAIFTDPARPGLEQPDITRWPVAYNGLDDMLQTQTPGSIAATLTHTDEQRWIAWNLAAVSPWLRIADPPGTKKKANALPPVGVVAREGYKAANKLTDIMAASHRHLAEILDLKAAVLTGAPHVHERDRLGMAIRRWDAQGGSWRLQVLAAVFAEVLERLSVWPSGNGGEHASARDAFVAEWQKFLDHLVEMDVMDAPQLKRLVDGRELAKALGVKPGKWTGQALDVCVAWQLRNPDETDPAPAIEEVKQRRKELGIPDAR